ncbi:STAS domain-containing protein [Streptomyces sp. NPDC005551]|uniref:STAS domain-containing protein n=1 Tax=unclassified Streptomyces TaxID=2593676 RepID=UPI0033F34B26
MATHDSAVPAPPVIVPRGDLDASNIAPVADELEAARTRHHAVILDLSGVTFGDSSFLNLLLRFHQLTDLRLAATPTNLARLFDITGADTVLRLYPTVDAARDAPPA